MHHRAMLEGSTGWDGGIGTHCWADRLLCEHLVHHTQGGTLVTATESDAVK